MTRKRLEKVVVAGGGIGGLAAALACARQGVPVQLLERATQLSEVGAGIQIGPNVTRILQAWGLGDALVQVAAFPKRLQARDAQTGQVLGSLRLGERAQALYGAPYATIHRADLQAMLHTAVQAAGVDVRLSQTVQGWRETEEGLAVTTAQGLAVGAADQRGDAAATASPLMADALIGADGVWSAVRQQLLGDGPARFSGHLAYRALVAGGNPRWGSSVAGYLAGAASVTVDSALLTGLTSADTPGSWHLSNGILRVGARGSAGTLTLTSYLTSSWGTPKVFDLKRNGVSLGAAQTVTVLRNDPSECVVRLTWDHAPARSTVDLSLKRGARHVAVTCQQSNVAGAWRVDDNGAGGTVTDQLTAAGYIATTSNDADGDRWVMGTGVACAAAGTFGFVASTPAQALAAYIGCVRGGASPAAGDAAADINAQWLGTPAETEKVIQR